MPVIRSRYRPDLAAAEVSRRAMAQNPILGLARAVAPSIMSAAIPDRGLGVASSTLAAVVDDFRARGAAIERNERHKAAMLDAAAAKRLRKAERRRGIVTTGA